MDSRARRHGRTALARRLFPTLSAVAGPVLSAVVVAVPARAAAQDPPAREAAASNAQALRVFLDCDSFRYCDPDFYRREIPYINYTRDREDAQVHLLVSVQTTGAGGQQFTLDFIGREDFAGVDDRLELSTQANLAEERVLTRLARRIQLGLARYIARTGQSDEVRLVPEGARAGGPPATGVAAPEDDPWNFWTFRLGGSGFYSGQEQQSFAFANLSASANRITDQQKLETSVGFNYSESNFDLNDSTTFTSVTRGYSANFLFVRSAGPKVGWGFQLGANRSTFSNEQLTLRAAPAVEYNLFPYDESARRQIRFLYSVGLTRLDYEEETIFFEQTEVVPDHRLGVSGEVRQPWGSANLSIQFVQHLNDLSRHRIRADGGVELRLVRGLSLRLDGGASRIRDQINIAAGDASDEEVLTRQRELETGFEYNLSVGLSYTFGSIFSNVVNPRFGGRNGFFLRGF